MTTTFTSGLVRNQLGYLIGVAWVVLTIGEGIVIRQRAIPEVITAVIAWPLILYLYGSALHLYKRARRQAAHKLATRDDADVPLRDVDKFDYWLTHGRYSRANVGGSKET